MHMMEAALSLSGLLLSLLLLLILFVNHLCCGVGDGGAQMASFQLELEPAGHLDSPGQE